MEVLLGLAALDRRRAGNFAARLASARVLVGFRSDELAQAAVAVAGAERGRQRRSRALPALCARALAAGPESRPSAAHLAEFAAALAAG